MIVILIYNYENHITISFLKMTCHLFAVEVTISKVV